jgi:signal transduction histidine kinase
MAEKEDFLRAVSHDLGAPLRNIAGMATLITMKWRDQLPEEVLARLQRIQANVDMETGMIHELLELSRIKSQPESRTWVDFNALMQELADTFEYELKAKNVHLEVASRMPRLYVEKNRVRQVFQNLIDNAIKYVGERPNARVQVAYERRGEMHQFSVADNGPGIPPEDQERIFHVFRRSPSTATASIPGKGVGLAVVKTVVSNYEGRAWVESPPGGGSTFYVALSVSCTEGPPESANERAKRPELAAHPVGR